MLNLVYPRNFESWLECSSLPVSFTKYSVALIIIYRGLYETYSKHIDEKIKYSRSYSKEFITKKHERFFKKETHEIIDGKQFNSC